MIVPCLGSLLSPCGTNFYSFFCGHYFRGNPKHFKLMHYMKEFHIKISAHKIVELGNTSVLNCLYGSKSNSGDNAIPIGNLLFGSFWGFLYFIQFRNKMPKNYLACF